MPLHNATNKVNYKVHLRKLSINDLLLNIDRRLKEDNDYIRACESIKALQEQEKGEVLTKMFKSYLKEVKDYDYVYHNVEKITAPEDAMLKIVAARNLGNPDYIEEVLADKEIKALNDSFINLQLRTLKKA